MATAVEAIKAGGMSFEELQTTPEWNRLSPPRRVWMMYFFANGGDAVDATRRAFHCKSEINVRNLSRQVERSPRVRAVLNLYTGKTQREVFLEELERTIRASEDGSIAKVRAMSLFARLKFDLESPDEPEEKDASKNSPEPTPIFAVGDPIIVDGVKRRVTAVDKNGRPTDVTDEPVE